MSQACCTGKSPLVRAGTAQGARVFSALDPETLALDGRRLEHFLAYLSKFAEQVAFFDADSTRREGGFAPFLDQDPTTRLSKLLAVPANVRVARIEAVLRKLGAESLPNSARLDAVFEGISEIVLLLDGATRILDEPRFETPSRLRQLLGPGLRPALGTLMAAYASAQQDKYLGSAHPLSEQLYQSGVTSPFWVITDWAKFVATAKVTYAAGAQTLSQRVELLRIVLSAFAAPLAGLETAARADLARTLGDDPSHEPQMALVLAFLSVFEHAVRAMDGFAARHLDYYYERVLRLRRRAAEPDAVFLTFGKVPRAAPVVVPSGTRFGAGQDAEGHALEYELVDDVRVTRAELSSVAIMHVDGAGLLRAAPVADSEDGLGKKLATSTTGWRAFGADAHPLGSFGFAVASRVLALSGGTRTVTIEITLSEPASELARATFQVLLTGSEGWLEVPTSLLGTQPFALEVKLGAAQPAIVGFDAKLHIDRGTFDTAEAVCLIILKQNTSGESYSTLRQLKASELSIDVVVEDTPSLQITTQHGPVDPTKEFAPFGAQPMDSAKFSVDCPELLGKAVSSATLYLDWNNLPGKLSEYFEAYASAAGASADFSLSGQKLRANSVGWANTLTYQGSAAWTPDPIALTAPVFGFGHLYFAAVMAQAVLNPTRKISDFPNAPFTPTVAAMRLGYHANATTRDGSASLFHVGPFRTTSAAISANNPVLLLPQFNANGELYLALRGAELNEQCTLLITVEEGSGDPTLLTPEIDFAYLAQHDFRSLLAQDVLDGTNALLRSGIVRIRIPADARCNTPDDFVLRLSLRGDQRAVARILSIRAHAGRAVLCDPELHPTHSFGSLPAGSIAKPNVHIAGLQKVEQPAASFGGRAPESQAAFRVRASERLRHKGRAVSVRDYEVLVLDAFPGLYSVRCLSHTAASDNALEEDRELTPGAATLVPIAKTAYGTALLRQLPYASQATLEAIEAFIRPLIGPDVEIYARNARFETVNVQARVGFSGSSDPSIGRDRLVRDLTLLLSPWARCPLDELPDVVQDGSVHRSSILHFIESRDYVDYVDDLRIDHFDATGSAIALDVERITATGARSVLSSGPHSIEPHAGRR